MGGVQPAALGSWHGVRFRRKQQSAPQLRLRRPLLVRCHQPCHAGAAGILRNRGWPRGSPKKGPHYLESDSLGDSAHTPAGADASPDSDQEVSSQANEESPSPESKDSSNDGLASPGQRVMPDELSNGDFMSLPAGGLGRGPSPPLLKYPGTELPLPEKTSWSGAKVGEDLKDPLLGTTLHDTYVVERVLGQGGMGRVYEARHTRIQTKRYAIKVLHSEFSLDPALRLRFQREAEAAATIEHDGVVGTYDLGQTPQGWPYMVCEYLGGEDLNDYLKRRGPLPARTVVHIGRQLCSALRAAHARGVIHRDLKPHNVFVIREHQAEGQSDVGESTPNALELPAVKVLDFGLSRFVENDSELTKTGIILGTPGYMAPEQANGLETDHRTDIYGIGALLFASATGRPPFKEETPQLTVLAVMGREPPRPRDLLASVPEDLEIVIQRAMARAPNDRYQNAGEMELALADLYAASTPLNRRGYSPLEARPTAARVRLLLLLFGGALLGGLSLLGALIALLEIKGIDYTAFRPSALEWSLFVLLALFVLFPVALLARHFKRRIWDNSARVAQLVPQVRGPLVAASVAYGLSALAARLAAGLEGLTAGGLEHSSLLSTVVWYVVLPTNALLAACAVVLKNRYGSAKSPLVRATTGAGYVSGAVVAALSLLVLASVWKPEESSTLGPIAAPLTTPESPHKPPNSARAPKFTHRPTLNDAKTTEPKKEKVAAQDQEPSTRIDDDGSTFASSDDLAIATEDGAEALEALSKKYPRDSAVLKALVLAHASRADTLERSVQAIGRLLDVEPGLNKDVDVRFILSKALRSKGKTSNAAFVVLKKHMGTEGAELLYEVMSEHPEQRKRLTPKFHELRKAKRATEEVLVAYDLKYATSCQARLQFLDRAEKHGDTRSLHQLQALSTAPRRCGWGRTCYPPCRAEAKAFARSATKISERLAKAKP